MKKSTLLIAFLFAGHLVSAQFKEVKAILKCYDAYTEAVLHDKGDDALKQVDTNTVNYYNKIADLVRTADSATVVNASFMDELMILLIRHKSTREEILAFTGSSLFVYAVNNGMVGKEQVQNNSIGKITMNGNVAEAQLVVGGTETPFHFTFRKTGRKTWALDLAAVMQDSEEALATAIANVGMSKEDFILQMLPMSNGQPVKPDIWHPVK